MKPTQFLFELFADFNRFSPEHHEFLLNKAENSYSGSWLESQFDKHWYLAFVLPVLLLIIQPWLPALVSMLTPQQDEQDQEGMQILDLLTKWAINKANNSQIDKTS